MKNILFVCTGNSCRSVMAEGLFKKLVQNRAEDFSVSSAGISAFDGFSATLETIQAMKAEGIDMSAHRSRRLTADMVEEADKIYVMERLHADWIEKLWPKAKGKIFLLGQFSSHPTEKIEIPDPIRMSDHFYKNVLDLIRDCVKHITSKLQEEK